MTREEAKTVFLNRGYVEVEGGTIYDADKWRESCRVISEWLEQEPCDDCISRQAVQDYIAKYLSQYLYDDVREAVEVIDEYIGELPSVKPQEPKWIPVSERLPKHYDSHDLIHRETARRIIDSPRTKEQMLMVLASAENQKKTGHWVYEPRKRLINETDEVCEYITEYWCKCSECGGDFGFQKMSDAYCKYCGAKMEVENNG